MNNDKFWKWRDNMKTKLDLTNYNNFYKTESEKEELKKRII